MNNDMVDGFNLFSVKNKVALITGATGHLGREIAKALALAGAHVIINARSKDKLQDLMQQLKLVGKEATVCCVDLLDKQNVSILVKDILSKFGKLDILINNAYFGKPNSLDTTNLSDFSESYDIAVTSIYHLIKVCRPFLENAALDSTYKKFASVINISSMYAHVSPDPAIYGESGFNNPPYYGAAKAALLQLTRYLACHLAPFRIRVNSVSPGPFPPDNLEKLYPDFYQQLCKKVPLNRVGMAHEIQGPILFLASEASSFMTGADLKIDGGWTAW